MNLKNKKIYDDLLEEAAELVVTLRSWGFHNYDSMLARRNADTGKPVGGWAGDRLEKIILEIHSKNKKSA